MFKRFEFCCLVWLSMGLASQSERVLAQQAVISTPRTSVNSSFFENIGVGFSGNIGGVSFRGPGPAPPVFGGGIPGGGASGGFGIRGSGGSLNFGFSAEQGSSRSISSVTPSVTVPNGGTGTIFSGSQRPFVTGLIPVVGGYGYHVPTPYFPVMQAQTTSPLRGRIQRYYEQLANERTRDSAARAAALLPHADLTPAEKLSVKLGASRDSSAGYGDLSVTEIRARRTAREAAKEDAERSELAVLMERARGAEAAGKLGAARIYYRQAVDRATGQAKAELQQKLQSLQ